jgi:predicted MFS family arabinose efflux permease
VPLGVAQTLAWGSSFYLPAMLAAPMARDLGLQASTVYAALSMALVISALISPWAGRRIDALGGRPVLLTSSALFVSALLLLSQVQGLPSLVLAWVVMGAAMGTGLYDAAFAALVRLFGPDARRSISGITLIAGFASSVGWPLTAWMEARWGWRGACLGWAALHLLVVMPLNLTVPRLARVGSTAGTAPVPAAGGDSVMQTPKPAPAAPDARTAQLVVLAALFTLMGFVSTAIATHLPAILQAAGAPLATAVALAALAGPSQVASRLFELGVLSRFSPLLTARIAASGHPLGALVLLVAGPVAALPFVVIHGLGNGLLTIVRGTLPLALFGAQGYGARQGWISLPGRLLGALSPWLMGLALEHQGVAALGWTMACGLGSLLLLLVLQVPAPAARLQAATGGGVAARQNRS